MEFIIYDDFNSRVKDDQDSIGTIIPNNGNDALRNGTKLIIVKEKTHDVYYLR